MTPQQEEGGVSAEAIEATEALLGRPITEAEQSGFVLPGTSVPSTCAVCGAVLLLDENRETGWRCPCEETHPTRCARDSDWCDGVICRERGIDCPHADPIDPHSWVLVDYDDPDEHEVCSRCGSRRNKHGRLTGAGRVPNCEAAVLPDYDGGMDAPDGF